MTLDRIVRATILTLILVGGPAMAVEEPAFGSVLRDGAFEVRDYPALVVAEVTVSGGQTGAAGKGFRLLAGYIFGGNRGSRSIAMTAPVTEEPAGGTIATASPVTRSPGARGWVVRFTMPSRYSLASLPRPDDDRVRLRETPPQRMAVIRFSGVATPRAFGQRTAELSAWIARRRLRAAGAASLAQYDPPWTPWFLRRNEVMIPVNR